MQNLKTNNHIKKIGIIFILFASSNTCFATDDSLVVRKSILSIIEKISEHKTVDNGAIGPGAKMSNQYKLFLNILELATDKELVTLTDDKNENVRVYSFWALAKRKYADIKTIFEKHLQDTAQFRYHSGCMISPNKVNHFFLSILTINKIDRYCFKLSDSEIAYYRKRLLK